MITDDRTNAKQLYVGMTRGRTANHVHAAPPAFDPDQHGPTDGADEWTSNGATAQALQRQPDGMSAIARRRQLREIAADAPTQQVGDLTKAPLASAEPERADEASERVAAAMRRLQSLTRGPSRGLER